ncbi:MAG: hypothetical protein ACUVTR_02000 [Dehalococcoidia bacterium]
MNPAIIAMIRASGRSWWQARYSDGKILSEWDTLTDKLRLPFKSSSRSSRWEDIPKNGMVGLRLLCPNGMAGELEAPEGHKFFQLKVGSADVSIGFVGQIKGVSRNQDAHIIGVVINDKGDCLCRAWETKEKRLIEFHDNVLNMKYRGIGKLNLDVQGIK